MKKLFAGILAGALILGSMSVFAGETEQEIAEINWEDMVAADEQSGNDLIAQGDFVTFDEIAVQMWVPNVLQPVELTDEDKENGYIGYFATEEQDAAAAVQYVDVDGMSLDEYMEYLQGEDGVKDPEYVIVNGIQCISYDIPDTDTTCISFETQAGYILEFSFSPMSDEGFQAVIAFMGASIMPEAEAETEAA